MKRICIILFVALCCAAKAQITTFSLTSTYDKEQGYNGLNQQINTVTVNEPNKRIYANSTTYIIRHVIRGGNILIYDCKDSLSKADCTIEFQDKGQTCIFEHFNNMLQTHKKFLYTNKDLYYCKPKK